MERYVKVVISLLILLAILSPVISLLQKEWSVEKMLETITKSDLPAMKDIDNVLQEGEQLRKQQADQSMQLVKTQVEQMVTDQIENVYPGLVNNIDVFLREIEDVPQLEHVRVVLNANISLESESSEYKSISNIEPVKPIHVHIEIEDQTTQEEKEHLKIKSAEQEKIKQEISTLLIANFPWLQHRLTVMFDTEQMERG